MKLHYTCSDLTNFFERIRKNQSPHPRRRFSLLPECYLFFFVLKTGDLHHITERYFISTTFYALTGLNATKSKTHSNPKTQFSLHRHSNCYGKCQRVEIYESRFMREKNTNFVFIVVNVSPGPFITLVSMKKWKIAFRILMENLKWLLLY